MNWLERHEEFDLSAEELAPLEQQARDDLGDERYEQFVAGIKYEVMKSHGTGDIPPGYIPDTDPVRIKEHHTARNILLGTLAALGVIGGAVVAYKKFSAETDHETEELVTLD